MSETPVLDNILAWLDIDRDEEAKQWLAHVIRAEEPCGCNVGIRDQDEYQLCDEWQKVVDEKRERDRQREEMDKEEAAARAITRMKARAEELGVPYELLP